MCLSLHRLGFQVVLGGIADEFGAEGGCHLGTEEMLSLTDQQEPYRRFLEQPRASWLESFSLRGQQTPVGRGCHYLQALTGLLNLKGGICGIFRRHKCHCNAILVDFPILSLLFLGFSLGSLLLLTVPVSMASSGCPV